MAPAAAAPLSPSPSTTLEIEQRLRAQLDAPLLFVKRHSYTGIHIYDTYYKWPPGGGGIYVLENPAVPREQWSIRPVIDETTPGTLGHGVYTHPELSWDATTLLFCFKGEPEGSTSIYEIGIDGRGLRRVSDPRPTCAAYKGRSGGQHDVAPAYLPDGRIVCLSTRPSGLVPCNNTGVAILHVMNADGSDLHPISVNNVNEFDPAVLPDGRLLFGRWEYVDKNALTIQSLWSARPDGTQETAFYANNMVFPEAVLDARPVPGSHLIVGTLAKHNSTPRGAIGFIDPHHDKNDPRAIANLEHPDKPTTDTGDSCEPWPLSENVVIFSGRPQSHKRNVLEVMDRDGHRFVFMSDPDICLHSPMLVKPRPVPPVLQDTIDHQAKTGRFFVQDIYRGPTGVKRGEVKWLRVIEETSRVSETHPGGNPYNQTFLVSAALAFSVKNYLGVVPVDENGSAYFEVPAGRAVYFQALDADGRLVHSMRTFVQAAPGTTRSCVGCHEYKADAPPRPADNRQVTSLTAKADFPLTPALSRGERENGRQSPDRSRRRSKVSRSTEVLPLPTGEGRGEGKGTAHLSAELGATPVFSNPPAQPQPESWGSGFMDYPSMVQPVLDRHCVSCHGGKEDIAAGLDLSGGWTEHFNISYENLANRRETQLVAYWIAGIDCMNGTAHWSCQIFPPRGHGSGAAPLAKLLLEGHGGRIASLTRQERDLLMAWIDSNGLYHGTWNYTKHGHALAEWPRVKQALVSEMQTAGCVRCHAQKFESDWFNLQTPAMSRILRAPLPKDAEGFGLSLCRDRKVDPRPRVQLLVNGYAHAVQPVEAFAPKPVNPPDPSGAPVASFASTQDKHYQAMLEIIRGGRDKALTMPRVDMPGAEVVAGECRMFLPPPLPETPVPLEATVSEDGVVQLAWEQSVRTIGLEAEVHRSAKKNFKPDDKTFVAATELFAYADASAPEGRQHYALVLVSGKERSRPVYASVSVPKPRTPPKPAEVKAEPGAGSVRLRWGAPEGRAVSYLVFRAKAGAQQFEKLTPEPIRATRFTDGSAEPEVEYAYAVRAVSVHGVESELTSPVVAAAKRVTGPVFAASFDQGLRGRFSDGEVVGRAHGKARSSDGMLQLTEGGHVTFAHREEFDLMQPLTVECWVRFEQSGEMPVIVSCGAWQQAGWFLQRLGGNFRWHVGGIDCDGGKPAVGQWIHLLATFDGQTARLFQGGLQVAEKAGTANTAPWPGELHIGQYSGAPGVAYQVTGQIAGVKIYHRTLTTDEAARAAEAKPQPMRAAAK
ncbi:MAG: hypothetical protein HYY24_17165 [Verrucomicrobia bacterium]|nr:hypothetical protein [Verrucomicrobiota bacterium]